MSVILLNKCDRESPSSVSNAKSNTVPMMSRDDRFLREVDREKMLGLVAISSRRNTHQDSDIAPTSVVVMNMIRMMTRRSRPGITSNCPRGKSFHHR